MYGLQYVVLVVLTGRSEGSRSRNNPEASFRAPQSLPKLDDDVVNRPVPFGHITKEGFGDIGGLKAPIDMLELSYRSPKESNEARELLKTTKPENIQFSESFLRAKGFSNPRDKILKELGIHNMGPEINETKFRWYDLADLQARNVARPPVPGGYRRKLGQRPRFRHPGLNENAKFVNKTFTTANDYAIDQYNFTNCDKYGSKSAFHPNDIVDIDWVPFYIWSPTKLTKTRLYSFTYATKKLVQNVREIYRKFIVIDWEQPKLVFHGLGKFLLVAADKRGMFHALQLIDSPPKKMVQSVPYTKLRIKIEDPYLVVLYCTDILAVIMAVNGKQPRTDQEKIDEASTIDITGPGWPVSRDLVEEQIEAKAIREFELQQNNEKQQPPAEGTE